LRGLDYCVIFGHEEANQAVCNILQNHGFDVKDLLAQQRITILGGNPSGEAILETIRGAFQQILARGAPLIRLLGNIGWGKPGWPGDHDLLAFEAKVTAVAKEFPCVVLCMYDVAALPGLVLRRGAYGTHPLIERDGSLKENPDYIPADFFLKYLELIADALSERRQAQAESRGNEERFRSLFDHSIDAVLIADHHGNIEAANPEACRLFGRTEEEICRIGRAGLVDPTDTRLQVFLAEREQTGRFKGELNFRRKDASVFLGEVSGTLYKDKSGVSKASVIIRDITERKRVEEELRRSEAYLTEAQRLSHTGSWAWNIATGEALWSREIYRIFGLDPEQTSLNVDLIVKLRHPEDRALAEQILKNAVREKKDFEFESRIVRPDGTIRHVRSVGRPVVNNAGTLLEFVGAVMDVTEEKTKEDALRKSQADLAHVTRVATLGEMSASIAHEVNQPLAAAVTSASACLRWLDAQKLEEARQSASRVIAEVHRASEIIDRIRSLTKKAPPQKDWFDVNETIHEVISLVRSEIQRNNIALEIQLSEHVPAILADHVELQQVLLNLVMNSIEAMSGLSDGPRGLLVQSTGESEQVVISVQDSGPGIDPENLDHLFKAFYTTKPQGMGMGLAISRSIIEAHGGRLWATANTPRGAVFQFILPLGSR
jgi:PAS domain S-box-containing protein